jgi:hypothetical protein
LLSGQTKRIKVNFNNANAVDYDPAILSIVIYRSDNIVYKQETYSPSGTVIIKDSTGNYHIDFTGDTNYLGDYQFVWAWRDSLTGDFFNGFQMVSLIPVNVIPLVPTLRSQLDKAQLDLNTIFGYNDENLYMYLKGAVSRINMAPPNTDLTLVNFPYNINFQLVIDVATFIGLEAQGLLSISTDANYNLQGNSMTVDHWSKISQFLSMLEKRTDLSLRHFKLNYLTRIGAVKSERGPGFRQVSIFSASPGGTSFGNFMGVR